MNVNFFNEENVKMPYPQQKKPKYGFFKFIVDCLMTIVTAGFWLIWVFVREMRGRR